MAFIREMDRHAHQAANGFIISGKRGLEINIKYEWCNG
jgi:hypothetical protein